jgi:hypothetical protein
LVEVSQQPEPQDVPEVQTQFVAAPEQTFPVPHDGPFPQCPLESQVCGTPLLHWVLVGVQSAQAFATQAVQDWVFWTQVPWLLQVPAS